MTGADLSFEKLLFVRLVLDKHQGPIQVAVGGENNLAVNVRPLAPDEVNSDRSGAVHCTVKGTWRFAGAALSSLQNVSKGLMPDGREPDQAWNEFMERILSERMLAGLPKMQTMIDLYPQSLRDDLRRVRDHLMRAALDVVGLVRWRMDSRGGRDPVREDHGLRFSFDAIRWHRLPDEGHELDFWAETHAKINPEIEAELLEYATTGTAQPLGHELLREAFSSRSKNPRSALLMTMTALEVGLKEFIADLVPLAEWLAFEAPSPSVIKILTEYLPKLPSRALSAKIAAPPKSLLDTIKVAVTLRNTVAHQGEAAISLGRLAETMAAVADILRVLDYHRGFAWSLKYVRDDVRRAWVGDTT